MDLERTQKPGTESSAAGTKMNTEGSSPGTVTGAGSDGTEVVRLKGLFGLLINTQDESVTRPTTLPFPLLKANPNFVDGVASRDAVISESPSIWARIFLPAKALMNKKAQEQDEAAVATEQQQKSTKKFPVVLYFHGGAFVMLSPDVSFYHHHCEKLARRANAIVVSVGYRLAPEHRLPAAYEDAYESLRWLRSQATATGPQSEPWLAAYADFGRVFLAGDSAGANVAYHAAVRAGATAAELSPLVVRGQLLLQPMVGGLGRRTRSEVEGERSGFFSYQTSDWLWRLSLPRGADLSHPYCDVAAAAAAAATKMQVLPPAIVAIGGLDWMHDRQLEFVAAMRRAGREVELVDYEHAKHGFFIYDCEEASRLLRSLATFIDKRSKAML